jgi:hypothetical protein
MGFTTATSRCYATFSDEYQVCWLLRMACVADLIATHFAGRNHRQFDFFRLLEQVLTEVDQCIWELRQSRLSSHRSLEHLKR